MSFTLYHLLLATKPHHFKNCLRTAEQTTPPGWDLTHCPTFWCGERTSILERLKADGLDYDASQCIFLPSSLWALAKFFRSIQHSQSALIVHGVPHRLFWFVMRAAPALLSHTAWIGWGAGVTSPWRRKEAGLGPAERIWFAAYNYCVPRLAVVSTQNTQELECLEAMVGRLNNHLPARYLLQGLPQDFERRGERRPLKICVGHRAGARVSDYEDTFDILGRFTDRDLEVHVPLSYGHAEVVPQVIASGRSNLGEAFRPMTEFMALHEYLEFLRDMDVLIMPSTYSMAGFNCTFGLSVGGKVFLRPENTYLQRYRDFGCHLFEFSELASQSFESLAEPLPESVQRANFAGTQSIQDKTRQAWHEMYARLVPASCQQAVAECTG